MTVTAVGRDPEPKTPEEAAARAARVRYYLWLARQDYVKAHPEIADRSVDGEETD